MSENNNDKNWLVDFEFFCSFWHADIRALNVEHNSLTNALIIDPHDSETVERLFIINDIFERRKSYREQFYPTMYILEDGKLRHVNANRPQTHAMVGQEFEG